MLPMFSQTPVFTRGKRLYPKHNYLLDGLENNRLKFVEWVMGSAKVVPSSYLLVKILQSLPIGPEKTAQEIFYYTSEHYLELANMVEITSPTDYGKVHEQGIFHGRCKELILATESQLTPGDFTNGKLNDWQKRQPIRIVYHPFTELTPDLLADDEVIERVSLWASIELDIPMLAAQYQQWYLRKIPDDVKLHTIYSFLYHYPLTSCLKNYLDIALFNRIARKNLGLKVDSDPIHTQPSLINYSAKIDNSFDNILEDLYDTDGQWSEIVETIPLSKGVMLADYLTLPKVPMLRQVVWLIVFSRLPIIRFITRIAYITGNNTDRIYRHQLRKTFNELKNDRALNHVNDKELTQLVNFVMNDIESMIS
ncbi:hypothetical protein [Endozoicomonas sp. ONNA1]|uniref:hypothetical protein n=1 Tax=Endozoicomonas sp. ONNA1 TaxID=2828740 RepID=UPI0021473D8F|nr:hypothetical protein [Endozoicomonas sp. ONNA1]